MSCKNEFEIERKFLIRMPDIEYLRSVAEMSHIEQTYLKTDEGSARVRKRGREGEYVYTHTVKKRLSDLRRIEHEREIAEEEYVRLLCFADPNMNVIFKDRYCVDYMGQTLEIELDDEAQRFFIPPWLEVIKEVTGDRRYTNAALAVDIPYDPI